MTAETKHRCCIAGPLRAGQVGADALRNVQRRREFPTRLTQ